MSMGVIMKVKEKLKDFKNRLTDRHMYTIVSLTLVGVLLWGFYQNRRATDYAMQLNNQYNRMFFDLTDNMNNVESLLAKSLICSSPLKTSETLQKAWGQANLAQLNIIQLPVSQQYLDNTSKFLTQVGDLAYTLNTQTAKGNTITNEQYDTIKMLYDYSKQVNENVQTMQEALFSGRIKWNVIEKEGKKFFGNVNQSLPQDTFAGINKTFEDYPTLIYDGPFSDHITQIEPIALGSKELTPDEAKEVATKFFGQDKIATIEHTGTLEQDTIQTYIFAVTFNNGDKNQKGVIDITRKGGFPYWALTSRLVYEANLNMEEATEKGKRFLSDLGFNDLTDTYYTVNGNVATINYAAVQGEYTLYPDLVKLQIALDNGDILGIESKGYLFSHKKRDIPAPSLSIEEAKANISDRVTVTDSGYAVIPTQYKTELFVYEFKGKLGDQDCLIYIGTVSGVEEEILLVINNEQGILTMNANDPVAQLH